ncbi:MAG: glycosyltransferase family 4 protein [Phycisphaerae bacterium]
MASIPALDLKKLAIMGTYVPRRCGIATFTSDLAEAVAAELGNKGEVFALALDDIPQGYRYPERVRFQLRANYQPDYRLAADFVMGNQANVFILQHEYGIFGGPAGSHVLRLLRELRIPVISTLHTILQEPTADQRRVLEELAQLCDRLVVMSHRARQMLLDIYHVPAERVALIPHGIPDVPFVDPNYYKDQFKAEGRRVILTFGLLSPNKGIEYMIEAMPEIVKAFPDVLYIVLGATHPHLVRQFGEAYRSSLQRRVADLGLQEHVRFRNQFVELEELCEYIGAADVYVTPYLHEAQITSGTLAYAVGAGKAVVSTPYWHAQELLADGRGVLVPFKDSKALADAVIHLFQNDTERHQIRKRAYTYCREMVWKQVAREYLLLGQSLLHERARQPRLMAHRRRRVARAEELPEVDIRHLRTITDPTGILQHCLYSTPDRRQGYSLDDNGRGLVVCALHRQLYDSDEVDDLAGIYLAYLSHAYNEKTNRFRNFMSYSRQWLDAVGSEDSQGKALWGLGMTAAHAPNENSRMMAVQLFQDVIGSAEQFEHPRAWAYSLLGIHAYLEYFSGDARVRRVRQVLAEKLFDLFRRNVSPDWQWCEPTMTYSNATLVHALILAGTWIPDGEMRDQGLRSLQWLCDVQSSDRGHFSFVGNQGWFSRGGEKAAFDQQPIEASQMVLACAEAYRATREEQWLAKARLAVEWFLGRNDLDAPLYDFRTGGCCDGLTPEGPNHNQGAESTLAWLIALLSFLIQVGRQTLDLKQDEEPAGWSEEWVAGR